MAYRDELGAGLAEEGFSAQAAAAEADLFLSKEQEACLNTPLSVYGDDITLAETHTANALRRLGRDYRRAKRGVEKVSKRVRRGS